AFALLAFDVFAIFFVYAFESKQRHRLGEPSFEITVLVADLHTCSPLAESFSLRCLGLLLSAISFGRIPKTRVFLSPTTKALAIYS
ncbi:MAG: hypothetical protein RLP15_10465, partial [Cryomorphaceae bacterium]